MKTKPHLLLLAAGSLTCSAWAQQEAPATPPATPVPAPAPASPPPAPSQATPPPGQRPPRPEGERRRFPAPERGPGQEQQEWRRGPGEERGPGEARREEFRREFGGPGESRREEFRREFGGPEGPHHEWRTEHPTAMSPQPFVGVMTAPLPPPLASQLKLKEGFGLLVMEVLPDSPAATAGIQKFDVLTYLNDQQLVEPSQLQALVRAAGKDAQVSLTVIRQGQEQSLTVKIGERAMPAGHDHGGHPPMMENGDRWEEMRDRMHEMRERMRDRLNERREREQREQRERGEHPQPDKGQTPAPPAAQPPATQPNRSGGAPAEGRPTAQFNQEDILRAARPGGEGSLQVRTDSSVSTLEGAKSRFLLKDADGEIEVATENGHRTLKARRPDGSVAFNGPVDTAEQRAAVPGELRERLAKIHLHSNATLPFPEERTARSGKTNDGQEIQ